MSGRFDGTVALVTGAGSGIGWASAARLAEEGAAVALVDISAEVVGERAEQLRATGASVSAHAADVRRPEALSAVVDAVVAEHGDIGVVFTAAGVAGSKIPSHELPDAAWFDVLDINLTGTFFTIRAALPSMLRRGGGAVVTCGSTSSFVATLGGGMAPYRSSKGGVKMLTQTLAMEYAGQGIRVNCVCPGAVSTGLAANTALLVPDGVVEASASAPDAAPAPARPRLAVPLGRYGAPEEIAAAVAFLASEDASYITGQSLLVDGGVTAE